MEKLTLENCKTEIAGQTGKGSLEIYFTLKNWNKDSIKQLDKKFENLKNENQFNFWYDLIELEDHETLLTCQVLYYKDHKVTNIQDLLCSLGCDIEI